MLKSVLKLNDNVLIENLSGQIVWTFSTSAPSRPAPLAHDVAARLYMLRAPCLHTPDGDS
ncbi:hypothetical protein INR49_012973 [Caranx melampygus]|nr:hypothetical protein INR49_012973 [Caranx melampygus]